jgi:hypothetical protein
MGPCRPFLLCASPLLCPDSGMSAASRSHYMNGNATIIAAEKLLDAMRKPDGTYRTYAEMVQDGIPTYTPASTQPPPRQGSAA